MKYLVIGGVAGGASAAAKLRRLDESAEIIMFERGEYISFANCGLPYHIGEVIPARDSLLVMTPEMFRGRTGVDVRTHQEVMAIDPEAKLVKVKNHTSGETYEESFDKLILSPGSTPFVPPLPGADDPDVMVLWTMNDMDRIKQRVDNGIQSAVVIGGGFIGVEVAENLIERGVETTLVELLPQVLPPLDAEMAVPLHEEMVEQGINLILENSVEKIERHRTDDGTHVEKQFKVYLKDGQVIETELVVMSVGVRPNSDLAKMAGLTLNARGGIVTNEKMQTSSPDIYAVGDAVEVHEPILGGRTMIPLAGPANRQGRVAAVNATGGEAVYEGSIGTSVCKVFDVTAASTGLNEKQLKQQDVEFKKMYICPASHASYYPGAEMMYIKVIFGQEGQIYGAQIVGRDGVDKRIDLLATAIKSGLKLEDLADLELAYAPPYGSAKDPINFVGFVGSNILDGSSDVVYPDAIPEDAFLLDVRQPEEVEVSPMPGFKLIPLGKLRENLEQLPKDQLIVTTCKVGLRGYLAERILKENGFKAANLSGGYLAWKLFNSEKPVAKAFSQAPATPTAPIAASTNDVVELNACGMQCPGPIVAVKQRLEQMQPGQLLKVLVSDRGFKKDLPAWCESTGNQLVSLEDKDGKIEAVVSKSIPGVKVETTGSGVNKRTTIVLFSNDLDKAMAGFIIATGFASLGHEVSIFCTFWGLNVLRKDNPPAVKKDFLSRMFGWMMPRGPKKLALSKMHMMGMGTAMMKHVMNSKQVDDLPTLIKQAKMMGVKLLACEMALNVMGIQMDELIDGVETAGVANFAALAEKSDATLFI